MTEIAADAVAVASGFVDVVVNLLHRTWQFLATIVALVADHFLFAFQRVAEVIQHGMRSHVQWIFMATRTVSYRTNRINTMVDHLVGVSRDPFNGFNGWNGIKSHIGQAVSNSYIDISRTFEVFEGIQCDHLA